MNIHASQDEEDEKASKRQKVFEHELSNVVAGGSMDFDCQRAGSMDFDDFDDTKPITRSRSVQLITMTAEAQEEEQHRSMLGFVATAAVNAASGVGAALMGVGKGIGGAASAGASAGGSAGAGATPPVVTGSAVPVVMGKVSE